MPIDYSKAKFYCIRAPNTNSIYIGSTTRKLNERFAEHRVDARRGKCSSKELVNIPGSFIELIEEIPCENKQQMKAKESQLIRNCPYAVNKQIPGRTKKEYNKEYRELRLRSE